MLLLDVHDSAEDKLAQMKDLASAAFDTQDLYATGAAESLSRLACVGSLGARFHTSCPCILEGRGQGRGSPFILTASVGEIKVKNLQWSGSFVARLATACAAIAVHSS